MDPHGDDHAFLAESARRLIARLRATAKQADPSVSFQLCVYFESALAAIEDKIGDLENEFNKAPSDPEKLSVNRTLRLLNTTVRGFQEVIPWLKSLKDPGLDLGILYFLEESAETLLKADVQLVINPNDEYMYSTLDLSKPFSKLLVRLGKQLPSGPHPILINYPVLERGSLLLHPLFVHELGHDCIERHAMLDEIYKKYGKLNELDQKFGPAVQDYVKASQQAGNPLSDPEAAVELRKLLKNWREEILCDLLALAYVGPSFLFAASAFIIPVSEGNPSPTHPPSGVRMELALRTVKELGWEDLLKAKAPSVLAWLQREAAKPLSSNPSHYLAFLIETLRDLHDTTLQVVKDHLGESLFKASDYDAVGKELEDHLEQDILPAQLDGDPVDRRALLTAGWLHGLSPTDPPMGIPRALERAQLQSFLTRSLEMSFILEHWRKL